MTALGYFSHLKKINTVQAKKTQMMTVPRSTPLLIVYCRGCKTHTERVQQLEDITGLFPTALGFNLIPFAATGYSPISAHRLCLMGK